MPTLSACEWFAAQANVNVTLSVKFYANPADATSTFKGDQVIDPGQKPLAFGDRAYTSAIAASPAPAWRESSSVEPSRPSPSTSRPDPAGRHRLGRRPITQPATTRVR